MIGNEPLQRFLKFLTPGPQSGLCVIRHPARIFVAFHNGVQDLAATYAERVAGDAAQFDVCVFQHLLNAVLNPVLILQQRHAEPGQIPQFTLPLMRDETSVQKTTLR